MLNKIIMNYGELKKIISLSIKIPLKKINDNSSAKKHEEWDSLGHLAFLAALDKKTKGKSSRIPGLAKTLDLKKIKVLLLKNKLLSK